MRVLRASQLLHVFLRCSLSWLKQTFSVIPIVRPNRIVLRRKEIQCLSRILFAIIFLAIDVCKKVKCVARVNVVRSLNIRKFKSEVFQRGQGQLGIADDALQVVLWALVLRCLTDGIFDVAVALLVQCSPERHCNTYSSSLFTISSPTGCPSFSPTTTKNQR